jgi:hypothetical protein
LPDKPAILSESPLAGRRADRRSIAPLKKENRDGSRKNFFDLRGTLGVSPEVQVGFQEIRLSFDIGTDAPKEKREELLALVERYCVIFNTLQNSPKTGVRITAA